MGNCFVSVHVELTIVIQTVHSEGVTQARDIVQYSRCWPFSLIEVTQMMEQDQVVYAALVCTIYMCSILLTRKHVDDIGGNELQQ